MLACADKARLRATQRRAWSSRGVGRAPAGGGGGRPRLRGRCAPAAAAQAVLLNLGVDDSTIPAMKKAEVPDYIMLMANQHFLEEVAHPQKADPNAPKEEEKDDKKEKKGKKKK